MRGDKVSVLMKNMSLWIYLHFPSLQLDALYQARREGQQHQEKQGHAAQQVALDVQDCGVVIVEGRKNEIVQLNTLALEQGVRRGMGLATAASMCSDLNVLPYDPKCEVEKLKEIAHWLYVVTADISLFEPNGVLLRASNMLTLYDGLDNYWQALVAQLNTLPFSYSFACGYSPFAARMLARKSLNQVPESQSFLLNEVKRCALNETELSAKQVAKLNRVGVNYVAELLAIPIAEIAKRFDAELVNYVGRLTGQFHHAVDFYHPPEQFKRGLDLLFEIENFAFIEKPLLKLLAQLEDFLRVRDQYAHELFLEMTLRDGQRCGVSVSSAAGDDQQEAWMNLFRLKFESVSLTAPIVRIVLTLVRAKAKQGDMNDLFAGKQGNLSSLELLSVLQAKLGEEAVKGVQLTQDPRPHLSSQFCPPLQQGESKIRRDKTLLRPSILLPSPKPLRERISIVQGPERVATGWWDGQSMIRDYFIARAANGSWLWVFRTPKQQWFLHGVFS